MCMWVLPAGMHVQHMHSLVPVKARRGHQTTWNWAYRWFSAAMWMLGIKAEFSDRVAGSFNC